MSIEKLIRNLDRLPKQYEDHLFEEVLPAAGQIAVDVAQAASPVDTGRLRDSITSEVSGDTLTIYSDVEYAGIQEARVGFIDEGLDAAIDYLEDEGFKAG